MPVESEHLAAAFGLVIAAAASTGLGAAAVFVPSIVRLANRNVLAASLGASSGVMIYVSFVEIFFKSITSFVDAGHDEDRAYVYATLCFFAGVIIVMVSIHPEAAQHSFVYRNIDTLFLQSILLRF